MRANGHFSGSMVAHTLMRPTRKSNEASRPHPSLFGLAPGGVYPTFPSPGKPVVSYTAFSPSPPSRWDGWAVVLCDTFRRIAPPPCYGAPRLCGARTFLILQLSHKTRPFFLLSANIILYPTTTFSNVIAGRRWNPTSSTPAARGTSPHATFPILIYRAVLCNSYHLWTRYFPPTDFLLPICGIRR